MIEWRYTAEGELVRVSTRSGRIIPKAPTWEETYDYAKKSTYKRIKHKLVYDVFYSFFFSLIFSRF